MIKFKIVTVSILTIMALSLFSINCFAQNETEEKLEESIDDSLSDLNLSELEQWFNENLNDKDIIPSSLKETIQSIIDGEFTYDAKSFFSLILNSITANITSVIPIILALFAIALLYSIVSSMSSNFLKSSTKEIIYFVCYSAMITIILGKVASLVVASSSVVKSMQSLMDKAFPVLLTLITALGSVSTSTVFQPLTAILSNTIVNLVLNIVMPLFITSVIIGIVGNLSKNIKLDRLTKFFKSTSNFILGGLFSIFVTFLTMQGLTGSLADTISVKTAKFALQSYVPLLGGYLSDGLDLVVAGIILIKNSTGIIILIMIMASIAVPVIQIGVFSLALKLLSGLVEPVCDNRFSSMLYTVSKNLGTLISVILGIGFMFILTVMLVIVCCNLGVA